MDMTVRAIVLWPRDTTLRPRVLRFHSGAVNVITGESQRGKSALIPIMDYCLGSSKCAIPVGPIRTKTAWFGVLLKHGKRKILLARREPEEKTASGDMYYDEGISIRIPRSHTGTGSKYCNVENVKKLLDDLGGLPHLDFAPGREVVGYKSRPGFRDMAAFIFQPQHIVANPHTLFFKADTTEHREKLKSIFPFVLGALDAGHLSLQHELADLQVELARLRRQMDQVRKAAEVWLGELKAHYLEARELGLLANAPDPDPSWSPPYYLSRLSAIPGKIAAVPVPQLNEGNTARAARELAQLTAEEESLSERISNLRRQLVRLERFSSSTRRYGQAVEVELERLRPARWLSTKLKSSTKCPICNSETGRAGEGLALLIKTAEELEEATRVSEEVPSIFDREAVGIRRELLDVERKISIVRTQRMALEAGSNEETQRRQTLMNVYRFIGRLEQALQNYKASQGDSDLSARIRDGETRAAEIKRDLDPDQMKVRIGNALLHISELANQYLPILGVERAQDTMELDIDNLTIRVKGPTERLDYLWEIGSGSNWLGYHVAALVSLQEHFLSLESSPVPSFLVLDQPSQVYFPERWPGDPGSHSSSDRDLVSGKSAWGQGRLDDIEGVRRIFHALALAVRNSQRRLQVIVVDHAGEVTWEGVKGVHLVERWRDGRALLPRTWLDDETQ